MSRVYELGSSLNLVWWVGLYSLPWVWRTESSQYDLIWFDVTVELVINNGLQQVPAWSNRLEYSSPHDLWRQMCLNILFVRWVLLIFCPLPQPVTIRNNLVSGATPLDAHLRHAGLHENGPMILIDSRLPRNNAVS